MVKFMNSSVLDKIDELVIDIKDSDIYKNHLFLEEKLSQHESANSLINEIKSLQKQAVKKEAREEDTTEIDRQIKKDLEQLESIPLYHDFIQNQAELNEIFSFIKTTLDNYFYDKLNGKF